MTVPDLTLYSNLGFALDAATTNLQNTELQLSTGKRVNQPSDPVVRLILPKRP